MVQGHTDEMWQGLSGICKQDLVRNICEIKNKGDDKWRNMGQRNKFWQIFATFSFKSLDKLIRNML